MLAYLSYRDFLTDTKGILNEFSDYVDGKAIMLWWHDKEKLLVLLKKLQRWDTLEKLLAKN